MPVARIDKVSEDVRVGVKVHGELADDIVIMTIENPKYNTQQMEEDFIMKIYRSKTKIIGYNKDRVGRIKTAL